MKLVRRAAAAVLVIGLVIGVFLAVLAFTFPTDHILRGLIARVTPPGGPSLTYGHAALRPWGLLLTDVSLQNPDGSIVAAAEWLLLRPSLRGFVRDRTGRPWHARGGVCRGSVEAVVSGDGAGSALRLGWRDLDLSSCALVQSGGVLEGLSEGAANLRLARDAPLAGEGSAHVRGARLHTEGLGLPLDALHADPAFVRWAVLGDKITLEAIEVHGPELQVNGSGTVRLKGNLADSPMDLRLVVTPGPEAPPRLRDALTRLPPASGTPGARLLFVSATLTELRRLI